MKRIFVFLLVLPMLAEAQSLGDAAKKERERRGKAKAGTAAKTVTDEELATNKGSLANDTKPAAGAKGEAVPAGGTTVALEPDAPEPRASSAASQEAYWRGLFQQARQQFAAAQRRHDLVQRMIRSGSGHRGEDGQIVIYSNQQLKTLADRAEAELKAAEAALERVAEDGRRAGALPGWFR